MRSSPWTRFTRIAGLVVGVLAAVELVAWLVDAASRGWPLGVWPSLPVALASTLGGLPWYFPAGALAGGIAVSGMGHAGESGSASRPRTWYRQIAAVAAGIALLSFLLRGYVGPHLLHRSLAGFVPAEIHLEPNDWSFFLSRVAEARAPGGVDATAFLAEVHGTVAFALLAALMLPLGLAIGRCAGRFSAAVRGRAVWAMAAATTLAVYGAQVVAWRVALAGTLSPAPTVYIGFLTLPSVMLLTLAWAGVAPGPDPAAVSVPGVSGLSGRSSGTGEPGGPP